MISSQSRVERFFRQRPLQSHATFSMTAWWIMDLLILIYIAIYNVRESNLFGIVASGLSILTLVFAWLAATKAWGRLHKLFLNNQIGELEESSLLYQVLDQSTNLFAILARAFFCFALGLLAALFVHLSRR